MNFNLSDIKNSEKLKLDFDAWKLFSDNDLDIIHIELKSGQAIVSHTNSPDVIFYVISGTGTLACETGCYTAKTGDCISIPSNMKREWRNNNPDVLKLLVIKKLKA